MDLDKMKNEMKLKKDGMKFLINMIAETTKEPSFIYEQADMNLRDKLNLITLNSNIITEKQYNELTNIVKQFEKVIDDYLKNNNIELKEI